ncbi:MAG TPA: carboxypeptidase regulatory-like domain-containing protein [Candidatus Saccharimonadales bacterium]|nr:carboxypeptidase regulatory-like domain-containing protein [Candidatus Saccharimonadales bacterium]
MRVRCAVVVFLAVLACLQPVYSQEITATLRGHVLDPDGSPLPGVPVTVSCRSRGEAKSTVMTDLEGRFKFALLPPASDYFLLVSYPGFATTEVGPIDLDAGKTTLQDVTLQPAERLTERVEVTAHGSIVDTTDTKTSTTFNTEFIEGLPIIGRNYQSILTLTPGVTDTDGDGNPNVQGARETGLQYRLDGGNITDPSSGTFGQNLNIDAIEEIEMITAGASAEYGRADGGFANIITKSGGNDFEGTFRLYWRGHILDGNGAQENNDTFLQTGTIDNNLRDFSPYLTLGGALRKDKLWYFASAQYLDRVLPLNLAGATIIRTRKGRTLFGKVTWQVDSDDKLALQYNDDPYTFTGLFLDFGVDKNSDATFKQGGQTSQLRWTAVISPTLLLETLLTHYDAGIAVSPVSSLFHPTRVETRVVRNGSQVTVQAVYPVKECSSNGAVSGFIPNCDPTLGKPSIYQIDNISGTVTGPFPSKTGDQRLRNSIRADLTYTIEDAWGEHQIKSGLEFSDEKFRDDPINNPLFIDNYVPCRNCLDQTRQPIPNAVSGYQVLRVPSPIQLKQNVVSFNSSGYLQDTWKPVPNVTVQAGTRIDREDIDTSGFTYFDPRVEKQKSITILESLCSDALRVARSGSGQSNAASVCDVSGRLPGQDPVGGPLKYAMDDLTPEKLRKYDVDQNGVFDSGVDGPVWYDPFTVYQDRHPENFEITNLNLSPRFSFAWDPWADGKTKVFWTWGRYYDRLFLDTVDDEMGPDIVNYTFFPNPTTFKFEPNMLSSDASAVSVVQLDRNLRTPFTDVLTLGAERELAPEWSAKLTYTQRLAWDLLQDVDVNHIQCADFPALFGIRSQDICPLYTDSSGKVHLSDDLFGEVGTGRPNQAPDLYIVNDNFNQVLRLGNYNSSLYRSLTLELQRRLHRNWQMQVSYTWSRVFGQAETFLSSLGDDPSTVDDEKGYLSYDQRHRVILIATSHLPKDVELGTTVQWESGTPYSVLAQVVDQDNRGNVSIRTFYPTHSRNDQRNDGYWDIDAKVIKRFTMGKASASASLAVNNILNNDALTLSAFRISSVNGIQLQQGPQGLRRFGRFWEVGFSMAF